GDPQDAAGRAGVEVEHDAERDDLAFAGRQDAQRRLEVGREAFREELVDALGHGGELLAPDAALLGAEVVEGHGACDLAEPRTSRAAPWVEAVPEPQSPLDRLAGQVVGRATVAGEPREVSIDVVQVRLCRL